MPASCLPRLALAALAALALPHCTKADLQAIDDVDVRLVDDLLELRGEVCTDPPEETDFPVKILFIIDGSGSMQFVDNPTKRALAVEEVILRLRANPSVSFAVIRFNEADVVLTKPGADITAGNTEGVDLRGAFTRDPGVLQQAVQGLRVADSVTDYQGALSTAYQVLAQDMIQSSKAELSRTKYVILFLSDGDPFPACCSMGNTMCDASTNLPFCSDPDAIRTNPTQLPYLAAGEDYNQPYQIYGAIRDIMDLGATFGVGDLRMHTAFLFDPSLVTALQPDGTYVIAGVVFVNVPRARELLGTMASIGQGVFRDFSRAEEIDFLGFDLTNIKRENALKNLIVSNVNLLPTTAGLQVDSDADGVPDDDEFQAGMNRLARDSDDDGFQDVIERRLKRNGFDPIVAAPGCTSAAERRDADRDGLARCEEDLLGSSDDLYDTDADGVPDGLEVTIGTDPAKSDALSDADLDAVRNGDEIRAHTNVSFDDGTRRPNVAYRYRTSEAGTDDRGGRCYTFTTKNVRLGTPLAAPGDDASFGRNDVFVWVAQAPADDPADFGSFKAACVRARYIAPDYKDPAQGIVELAPEDFHLPEELDPDVHCVGLGGTGTPE
ncbi:VWA domain-containing protein [Myxococcota bacterium]|nr:VWA domain-containing protein [Myxococcota bacterium]